MNIPLSSGYGDITVSWLKCSDRPTAHGLLTCMWVRKGVYVSAGA